MRKAYTYNVSLAHPVKKVHRQADELKARIKKHARKKDETFRVGVEIEVCLLDGKDGRPVDAASVIERLSRYHQIDYEYGKCQLEFKTDPVSMNDIEDLNLQFEEFIEHLERAVKKAGEHDVVPVFLGANPSPLALADGLITDKPRYRRLARWQQKLPDIEMDGQKFKAVHVASAIQGFHLHLQGKNPDFTAMMFNHVLNLIPSVILLGANSRLFAGRVFSLHEPRIFMYDQSERQNSGFPGISRYLAGAEDYIDYIISRKPVIAKDYSEMVKERHDDCRLRLEANNNSNSYRVEARVMSVQPTPRAMMAMIEFFIGYLHKAIHNERELRPLAALREERQSVVRSGFDAKTHFDVVQTAKHQIELARSGLADLGISPAFLNILDNRIENKTTAGEYVARLWQAKLDGSSVEKALAEVIADVWEKTRENKAIP